MHAAAYFSFLPLSLLFLLSTHEERREGLLGARNLGHRTRLKAALKAAAATDLLRSLCCLDIIPSDITKSMKYS